MQICYGFDKESKSLKIRYLSFICVKTSGSSMFFGYRLCVSLNVKGNLISSYIIGASSYFLNNIFLASFFDLYEWSTKWMPS